MWRREASPSDTHADGRSSGNRPSHTHWNHDLYTGAFTYGDCHVNTKTYARVYTDSHGHPHA